MAKVPCPALYELYETDRAIDLDGKSHDFDQNVPVHYAEALYELVRKVKPKVVVEVGLACGTTAAAVLTGIKENGGGKLISIDPGQSTQWHNCGVATIKRAGLSEWHELMEDFDYFALPKLLREGLKVDIGYIDGWHTFDYALLDWFYLDKMVVDKGIIGFNDSHFRSVHRVLKFVLSHRHYEEIDVGLPKTYKSRIPIAGPLLKRLADRSSEDRYFRKLDTWEPYTQFYAPF